VLSMRLSDFKPLNQEMHKKKDKAKNSFFD
jgi:hypothetical protein